MAIDPKNIEQIVEVVTREVLLALAEQGKGAAAPQPGQHFERECADGICVQTSWDDQSVGRCFETCDPLVQDCSRDGEGCYVLREYSGFPVCFQSWGFPEGTRCSRMTQCAEGLRCACDGPERPCPTRHCRQYCARDGSTACPAGTTCEATISPTYHLGSCQP